MLLLVRSERKRPALDLFTEKVSMNGKLLPIHSYGYTASVRAPSYPSSVRYRWTSTAGAGKTILWYVGQVH